MEFKLSKCKTKAAYSAKLLKPTKLNLAAMKKKYEIVLETPIVVIIKVQDVEVIVHGYGELLFKKCEDIKLMEKIAKDVYETSRT